MVFEQAAIKVEKEQQFAGLKSVVENAFQPENVERVLKQLQRNAIRIRDFDGVLAAKALEEATGGSVGDAQRWYQSLTLSDQAQMREFYLSKLEGVDVALRHKFKKLYQYY